MRINTLHLAACAGLALATAASGQGQGYTSTVLVANRAEYQPLIMIDPLLINAWGLATRPAGAGGHFWISNAGSGTTTTYVGDVRKANGTFTPLFQDELKVVDIPRGSGIVEGVPVTDVAIVTGQVYNFSSTDFVVSGEGITAAAKFIFVSGEGTISGWTEKRDANNVLQRQTKSVIMVDKSELYDNEVLLYTGVAVTDKPSGNRLYVSNWRDTVVEVFDANFQRVPMPADRFRLPPEPSGVIYRPWNVQYLRTGPNGEGRVWVTYGSAEDPWEEDPLLGRVGEFDLEGNFIRQLLTSDLLGLDPLSELRAPWGLAIAPANFGPLSGKLLVANFADGTIPAFDLNTMRFVDWVRDDAGQRIEVDGIWGILFGNGVALGDSDALYYAAGPAQEGDGTFGTIRYTPSTCPRIEVQPAPLYLDPACAGGSISVKAPGPTQQQYQWQRQLPGGAWLDLAEGATPGVGIVQGVSGASLSVAAPLVAGVTPVRVVIRNGCGEVQSNPVMLTIRPGGYANCDDSSSQPVLSAADFGCFIDHLRAGDPYANCDNSTTPPVLGASDFSCFLAKFRTGC